MFKKLFAKLFRKRRASNTISIDVAVDQESIDRSLQQIAKLRDALEQCATAAERVSIAAPAWHSQLPADSTN